MNPIAMKSLYILLLLVLLSACTKNEVHVIHEKTADNGLITWRVENPTDQDITRIEFIFRSLDGNGQILETDTVEYSMAAESPENIFLKAQDYTWVNYKSVEGASETEAFVIDYSTE